ncbi:hypothetical protein F2P56_004123 [Juglans regia]|uniref:Tf2-1-like SH3-like domain-containing protein n=2 Tax=Juglans regia TaxID=51240 RepID=A0A834D7K3_JUGRE|nr:uncharacterized protein LOC109005013 [Juglans regia]KAF5477486.1 hypothetical protein F2P56_004123 [Juglans regia]
MRAAHSRQKSYADNHHRQLDFEVGNKVFLRIAPMRGVMRFGKKGKLSPRFVGPFEILDLIGPVAYRVALPPALSGENLTYTEELMRIVERKEQVLRNCAIPLVKVVWNNYTISEASWELEEEMQLKYPQLFDSDHDNL